MKSKTKLLLGAVAPLISAQLFAATYTFTADNQQVNWDDVISDSSSLSESVLISGPMDGAYPESWVYLTRDSAFTLSNELKVNQGGILKIDGNFGMTLNKLTLSNGRNENSNQTSVIVLKGLSESERFVMNLTSTGATGTVGRDANTGSTRLELAGNVTLNMTNANSTFYLGGNENNNNFVSNATMRIYGANNTVTFNSFAIARMGDGTGTGQNTGVANLQIEGSSQNVTASNAFRFYGASDTSVDDVKGGLITFVADANGISSLNFGSFGSDRLVMTGVIKLDLSDFVFVDDSADFRLISTTNASAIDALQAWISSDLFAVYYNGEKLDPSLWNLYTNSEGLWVNVAAVPEPGVFAAVFGAVAFALAAYRRRK